ncbi:hypothetical protein H9185_001178 [Listeria monocytogenes]|nr:hypothetical protein [Listeria monocytogenes]
MGNNNEFFKKRDERDQKFFDAGADVGFQKCLDYVMNALRDPELVGSDIWGEKRLLALNILLGKYDDYFHPAWNAKHKEADYKQRELDARLKEGCGKYFAPFLMRYPYMKDISYNKPQKGWLD